MVKRRARRFIPRLSCRFLAREGRDARKRWRQGLRGARGWLTIPITAISMYALWHWAFAVGTYFGVSFVIAATLAILRGHILTHPFRLLLVAVAVMIATLFIRPPGEDAWQVCPEAQRRGNELEVGRGLPGGQRRRGRGANEGRSRAPDRVFNDDPHEESSHIEKLFWGPVSVMLDAEGRLYVTETNRHRLQVFDRVN